MLGLNSKFDSVRTAYTFDDFLLVPLASDVKSRKDPDISVDVAGLHMTLPIFSAPMDTITESRMLTTMRLSGGIGVLHRYMPVQDQLKMINDTRNTLANQGFSESMNGGFEGWVAVDAGEDMRQRMEILVGAGASRFCIDTANGHLELCLNAVKYIRKTHPGAYIMAGNVCTYNGAYRLIEAGADVIRVGIGGGSVCTTRLVAGHGLPQLSAIDECARVKNVFPDSIILSDGGIRNSGDAVKALAAGADAIMVGGVLSGTDDTPGPILTDPDTRLQYKEYNGMASVKARSSWFGETKAKYVPEGESTRVPYKGSTSDILEQFGGGIRSGLSYSGAHNLEELRARAQWIRITQAGWFEGTPHGKRA